MNKFKRILCGLLAAVLLLSFTGCSAEARWQKKYDLGVKYVSEGNYEEAILALTAAIKIDPNNAAAYLARAEAYVASAQQGSSTDNYQLAVQDYQTVLELDAEDRAICDALADLLTELGDTEALLELLQQMIEDYGADEAIHDRLLELGYVLEEDGTLRQMDWSDWNDLCNQVSDALDRLNLDEYYAGAQHQEKRRAAAKILQLIIEHYPEAGVRARHRLSLLYYRMGELDACLALRAELYAETGWEEYHPEGYSEEHTASVDYYNEYGQKIRQESGPVYFPIGLSGDVEEVYSHVDYEYDDTGRIVKESSGGTSSIGDGSSNVSPGSTTYYEYDSEGRIAKITRNSYSSTYHWDGYWEYTPETYVEEYSYEGDTVTMKRYHDGELSRTAVIELNEYGTRVKQTNYDADGNETRW